MTTISVTLRKTCYQGKKITRNIFYQQTIRPNSQTNQILNYTKML